MNVDRRVSILEGVLIHAFLCSIALFVLFLRAPLMDLMMREYSIAFPLVTQWLLLIHSSLINDNQLFIPVLPSICVLDYATLRLFGNIGRVGHHFQRAWFWGIAGAFVSIIVSTEIAYQSTRAIIPT